MTIIGAIAGDIIGSVYQWDNVKTTDFNLFTPRCDYTDDTVLTVAIAHALLDKKDFAQTIWEYGRKYSDRGYGGNFYGWLQDKKPKPYGSFGNGSAMRVSAVGFALLVVLLLRFTNTFQLKSLILQTANYPKSLLK